MNNMHSNGLEKTMRTFQENKVLNKILIFTIKIGLEDFVFRIKNKQYLKERKTFFEEHQVIIDNNIQCLYDEKSKDVYRRLIEYRKNRKRKDFPCFNEKDQYFPKDVISLNENEVFVDCGAFNGDTIEIFLENVNSKYEKIVCFEPDKKNYNELLEKKDTNENWSKVYVFNSGVFDKKCTLRFDSGKEGSSSIIEDGTDVIEVDMIDNIDECQNATFIKMDIEGSEPEAIMGAAELIKRNKPKLAICIYHSDEDMINIIGLVHKLVPDYKMFVRQHSIYETETVLYCTL